MSPSLTCKNCGTVLRADTEDELAALGQEHAHQHGHTGPLDRRKIFARIRRHKPQDSAR